MPETEPRPFPGTEAKIELLAARYEAGLPLFEPDDLTWGMFDPSIDEYPLLDDISEERGRWKQESLSLRQWVLCWLPDAAVDSGLTWSSMNISNNHINMLKERLDRIEFRKGRR